MTTTAARILILVQVGVPLHRAVDLTLGEGQYEILAPVVFRRISAARLA